MKKEYKIEGMSCNHCRMFAERALNSLDGVEAMVSLDPPVAIIEFFQGEIPLNELQDALAEAGDFTIIPM